MAVSGPPPPAMCKRRTVAAPQPFRSFPFVLSYSLFSLPRTGSTLVGLGKIGYPAAGAMIGLENKSSVKTSKAPVVSSVGFKPSTVGRSRHHCHWITNNVRGSTETTTVPPPASGKDVASGKSHGWPVHLRFLKWGRFLQGGASG